MDVRQRRGRPAGVDVRLARALGKSQITPHTRNSSSTWYRPRVRSKPADAGPTPRTGVRSQPTPVRPIGPAFVLCGRRSALPDRRPIESTPVRQARLVSRFGSTPVRQCQTGVRSTRRRSCTSDRRLFWWTPVRWCGLASSILDAGRATRTGVVLNATPVQAFRPASLIL